MAAYTKTTLASFRSVQGATGVNDVAAKSDSLVWPNNTWVTNAWSNKLTGETRSNWRKAVAEGSNATTPMDANETTVYDVPARWHLYGNLSSGPNYPDALLRRAKMVTSLYSGVPLSIVPHQVDVDAENLAQVKVTRNIDQIYTSFQGGVFLGELRETLRMIRNPLKGLRSGLGDYLNALKKGRRGSPSRRLKHVQDTWLEYSFGWMPLLSDLDAARDYLKKRQQFLLQELVPFKSVAVKEGDVQEFLFQYAVGIQTLNWTLLGKRKAISVYAGAIRSKALGPTVWDMSAMGLSPRSFVPTLWELLPWSFLVDYFTNVGDVITGWCNQGVSIAWGRHTTVAINELTGGNQKTKHLLGRVYLDQFVPGEFHAQTKKVTRRPISNIAPPELHFEIPGFGLKWVNMAALLRAGRRLEPF